jgi:hypothetical protein
MDEGYFQKWGMWMRMRNILNGGTNISILLLV